MGAPVADSPAPAGSTMSAGWPEVVCPDDGQPLTGVTQLECSSGHRWRIASGIARMVPPSNYSDAFGLQWKTFRKTQLDAHTGTTLTRDRIRRCLGEDCWALLHSQQRVDVLEAGCGAGRFTEILSSTGAYVTSVDMSAAVEASFTRHRLTITPRAPAETSSCLSRASIATACAARSPRALMLPT